MRDKKGRFVKGQSHSPKTQFKKGEHWRNKKPYWDEEWLRREYIDNQRSTGEIAAEFGVTDANVLYFLRKFGIERRDTSESRKIKHWGLSGETNGMYGKTGQANPRWRGGISPERQSLYSSQEWINASRVVWKRDKGICQRCGKHYTEAGEMHIHHLVPFSFVALRCDPSNLMLICLSCHLWIHSKKNTNLEFINEPPSSDSDN